MESILSQKPRPAGPQRISFINVATAPARKPTCNKKQVSEGLESRHEVGSSAKKKKEANVGPAITVDDLDIEVEEPPPHLLNQAYQHINVNLDLHEPKALNVAKNVFESAEYWALKGYQAHIGKADKCLTSQGDGGNDRKADSKGPSMNYIDQALDFYKQGLRIDNQHYGCCYNIGVTYFQKQKNQNALKWFRFAKGIDPGKKDPYLGEATAAFKLGLLEASIAVLKSRPVGKLPDKRKRTGVLESRDTTPSHSEMTSKRSPGIRSRESSSSGSSDSKERPDPGALPNKVDIENQFSFLKIICYK